MWFLLVADSQTGKSTKSTDGWTIEHYTTWVILCNTVFCCCAKSKVEEDGQQSTPVYMLVQCREPKAKSNRLIDYFQQFILSYVKQLTVDSLFASLFGLIAGKSPQHLP